MTGWDMGNGNGLRNTSRGDGLEGKQWGVRYTGTNVHKHYYYYYPTSIDITTYLPTYHHLTDHLSDSMRNHLTG